MHKNTEKQYGVAVIEFVLLLPLLLFIGWLSVDFGRLIFQYDAITKTTRDATRYLATVTRPKPPPNGQLPSVEYSAYKNTIEKNAQNLALCGSIAACTNTVVPGIKASNIRIDYQDSSVDVAKNCLAGITCVRISIINYKVTFITNDIAQLFGSPLIADNDLGISVTMRQIQQ